MSRFYFSSELTPRIVRGSVEEALSLESGTLDAKEYRAAVKETIEAAVVRVPLRTFEDCVAHCLSIAWIDGGYPREHEAGGPQGSSDRDVWRGERWPAIEIRKTQARPCREEG